MTEKDFEMLTLLRRWMAWAKDSRKRNAVGRLVRRLNRLEELEKLEWERENRKARTIEASETRGRSDS